MYIDVGFCILLVKVGNLECRDVAYWVLCVLSHMHLCQPTAIVEKGRGQKPSLNAICHADKGESGSTFSSGVQIFIRDYSG